MKTQTIYQYICALTICAALSGCTQNNGHIGKLFGSWALKEITCDGQSIELPEDIEGTAIAFQGSIVRFYLIYGPDDLTTRIATWSQLDNQLTFNFNNGNNNVAPGTVSYAPPEWLGFDNLIETVTITELSGSSLEFVRSGTSGEIYNYKFDKTW